MGIFVFLLLSWKKQLYMFICCNTFDTDITLQGLRTGAVTVFLCPMEAIIASLLVAAGIQSNTMTLIKNKYG